MQESVHNITRTLFGDYVVLDPKAFVGYGGKIGNFCRIGKGALIGNSVIIKDGCIIAEECVIENNVFMGPNCSVLRDQIKAKCGVKICNGAFIGAGSIIFPYVRIGKNAVIGAGSIIRHDVDENSTVYGVW